MMLLKRMNCRVEESQPVLLALNLEYSCQAGTNIYPAIHIYSHLRPSNTRTLRTQEGPTVNGTMSAPGIGPRKDQKHSPLFDPTAEKVMTSNWEFRGSQSTTFPSIILESEKLILWFPTILLPLVSSLSFFCSFFSETGILQISHPIRMKDD